MKNFIVINKRTEFTGIHFSTNTVSGIVEELQGEIEAGYTESVLIIAEYIDGWHHMDHEIQVSGNNAEKYRDEIADIFDNG